MVSSPVMCQRCRCLGDTAEDVARQPCPHGDSPVPEGARTEDVTPQQQVLDTKMPEKHVTRARVPPKPSSAAWLDKDGVRKEIEKAEKEMKRLQLLQMMEKERRELDRLLSEKPGSILALSEVFPFLGVAGWGP